MMPVVEDMNLVQLGVDPMYALLGVRRRRVR